MKLYMIRHGQTTCNVAGKHQGWGPVSLSEKGFEQARKAKEYVRTVNYDKIFVSDLLRTRQTAEILFPEKYRAGELEFTEDLREIDTGVFFGRTLEDMYRLYGDVYLDCRKKMDYSALGGEGSLDVKRRVRRFMNHLEEMAHESRGELKIAAVAHGGVKQLLLTLKEGQLGRGGAGVDDENALIHRGTPSLLLFKVSIPYSTGYPQAGNTEWI